MTLQQVQNFMLYRVYSGYTPQQAAANPYVCLASNWLRDTGSAPAGWFTPGTPGPWVEYWRIGFYLRRLTAQGYKDPLDISALYPDNDPMKPYILPGSNRAECIEGQPAGWFTPGTGGVRVTTPTGEIIEVSDDEINAVSRGYWSTPPPYQLPTEGLAWVTLTIFDSRDVAKAPPIRPSLR